MIATLNRENVFSIVKNSTVTALSSLMSDTTFYVATKVKAFDPSKCSVILVMTNQNKEIISTSLEKQDETDRDDYYKYHIAADNDFSLTEGVYVAYLILFNPESQTHLTSNTIRIMAIEGSDADMETAFNENILDEFFIGIEKAKTYINEQVERIKKLTELNIQINNEIDGKVGEK